MENIRHIPLKLMLVVIMFANGCAMNPFGSSAPAPVKDSSPARQTTPVPKTPMDGDTAATAAPESARTTPYVNGPQKDNGQDPSPVKTGPAVVALLHDAEKNSVAGRHDRAIASLERAVRIEPNNPLPWHQLGRIHLEKKNWKQALALAQKSNALAAGNNSLQAENWKIIAQASTALGDDAGATRARERVRQLEK